MSSKTKYEVDANQKQLYPKDPVTGNEIILNDEYALDEDKIPYYPRDSTQNEFMGSSGLIMRNGKHRYPLKHADGKPNYRKSLANNRVEVYEKHNDTWIIGTALDGNQYYATLENGDEYYPEDNTPAYNANGVAKYAHKNGGGGTIFPKDATKKEYYLSYVDPLLPQTIPGRYAKVLANEIYPERLTQDRLASDYILNYTYAKKGTTEYYPKDANNNEFYLPQMDDSGNVIVNRVLTDYAVTNDGKIILPAENNTYTINPSKKPTVVDTDVLGKIVRERDTISNNSDYLTKVESTVKPQVNPMKYKYFDLVTNIYKTVTPLGANPTNAQIVTPFYKTWYFWVFVIISFVVKSIIIWWFYFKSQRSHLNKFA